MVLSCPDQAAKLCGRKIDSLEVALLATPASPSFTLIFRVFLQDAPESNRVYRGLPPASPHKLFGSWLPAGGSSCRFVCGGSASFCLAAAGPLHPPPPQQQYVGSAAQAEAGLLARTLPGICECPAKSAGPAGKCWRIKLQVVTLQHLGKAQALPQMMRSPGRWGREGGEGLHECCCLSAVLQSF